MFNSHGEEPIRKSLLSKKDKLVFTYGGCFHLAASLAEEFNARMIYVACAFDDDRYCYDFVHAAAIVEDKIVIDVYGIWKKQDWLDYFLEMCRENFYFGRIHARPEIEDYAIEEFFHEHREFLIKDSTEMPVMNCSKLEKLAVKEYYEIFDKVLSTLVALVKDFSANAVENQL